MQHNDYAYAKAFILLVLLVSLIIKLCKYCCKCCCGVGESDNQPPVVVTSATHTAPGGYPVTQMPPGTYQVNAYPAPYPAPYPGQANVTVQMPMPNPAYPNQAPGMPPYPTHFQGPPAAAAGTTAGFGAGAANMNPPTYDMAVATQPSIVNYEKQSPYNPSYPQQ